MLYLKNSWQEYNIILYQFMKVNQQIKNKHSALEQITRNLVKSTLKSKSYNDKFVFGKSAVLSTKLRGRIINQNIHLNNQIKSQVQYAKNYQIQKMQTCVGTQCPIVPQKCDKEVDCSHKDVGYLKETSQFCTQTQLQNVEKVQQTEQDTEIQHINSKVSLETEDTYLSQGGFDSFCNFSTDLDPRPINFKKKQNYDEIAYNIQINNLKTQMEGLRGTIKTIDEQKNKWKKKALKYSSKIKAVEVEQKIFQTAYDKTIKKMMI